MAVNLIDEYLKFIQSSFNTQDVSFKRLIRELDAYGKTLQRDREIMNTGLDALILAKGLQKQTIIVDFDTYEKKFDKLADFDLDNTSVAYKVADEIINDIRNARTWLDSYERWSSLIEQEDSHERLILLGKSILGKAVELAPKDTGLLRSSGVLVDMGTYIVIAFTAPYAGYVHENMDSSHAVGRAKFLELAVQEFFPNRRVWVEQEGYNGVQVIISLNPERVEYKHYG